MEFDEGLSIFVDKYSVHTAYSFDQTDTNYGTDTLQLANSTTYGTATGFPNYGLAAVCDPDPDYSLDLYVLIDVCMMLYLPSSGYSTDTTYGLFHNGGVTNAQSGWIRFISDNVGWQLCINHNRGGDVQDEVYYTLGDITGWVCLGFQYEDNSSNMALWVNGVNVSESVRSDILGYGTGNPKIGDANGLEPTQWSGNNTAIDTTGILIADFIADNPDLTNSSPTGNGDILYTDYYLYHTFARVTENGEERITEDSDGRIVE